METTTITQQQPLYDSMDDEQVAHLAGVIDAVGNVTLRVLRDEDYRLDFTIQPTVELLRTNENDPLLGKLMAYAEGEGVKYTISEASHGADRESGSIKFLVKEPESIKRFLEPMLPYLATNYVRAEILLDEALPALDADEHLEEEGFLRLVGLADEIREGKVQRNEIKYDLDYFVENWSLAE